MTILSLTDALTDLNITSGQFDDEVTNYLTAATSAVDFLCGPTDAVTVTETVQGCGALVLTRTPVLSLTSVTGQYWGVRATSDLFFDIEAGVVRALASKTQIQDDYYTVVYQAGRSSVPDGIEAMTKIILKSLWSTRRGSGVRGQGGGDESALTMVLGVPVPQAAMAAGAAYLRGPSVA